MIESWTLASDKPWRHIYLSAGGMFDWKIVGGDTAAGPDTSMTLRYRWSKEQSFAIGHFRSLAEAKLAVEFIERRIADSSVPDLSSKFARIDKVERRLAFGEGADAGDAVLAELPPYTSYSMDFRDGRLSAPGDLYCAALPAPYRIPGIDDPKAMDALVADDLLMFRMARGAGACAAPVTEEELEAWRAQAAATVSEPRSP